MSTDERTLLDWQELLDEAIRGCHSNGMDESAIAEWTSETLREIQDETS